MHNLSNIIRVVFLGFFFLPILGLTQNSGKFESSGTGAGVNSIGESGETVTGNVLLGEGANITISRSGQTITIGASLSGSGVWSNFTGFVKPDDDGDGIHLLSSDGGDSLVVSIANDGIVTFSTPTGSFQFSQTVDVTGNFTVSGMIEASSAKVDTISAKNSTRIFIADTTEVDSAVALIMSTHRYDLDEPLIQLNAEHSRAKPSIGFGDSTKTVVASITAHDTSIAGQDHSHLAFETADASGAKQTRLEIGLREDLADITTHDAYVRIGGGHAFSTSGITQHEGHTYFTGTSKLGIGFSDSTQAFTAGASSELYRQTSNVEFLIHADEAGDEARLKLKSDSDEWEIMNFGSGLQFHYGGVERGTLDNSGNLSIDGALNGEIGTLRLSSSTELTISSGAVTITQSVHTVDTEADASSDTLYTISSTSEHKVIFLMPDNGARDIVLGPNTGNIKTPGDIYVRLKQEYYTNILVYEGADWHVINPLLEADDVLDNTFTSSVGFLYKTAPSAYSILAEIDTDHIADGAISGGTGGKIADGTVANVDLTNMSQYRFKMRNSSGSGPPENIKITHLTSATPAGEDSLIAWDSGANAMVRVAVNQLPSSSGDVSKVGIPVDDQVGVWTGDGTIEGDANFTWDGSVQTIDGQFHVDIASTGVTANTALDDIVIENTASVGITLLSDDTGYYGFGSGADSYEAAILYAANNHMSFYVNNSGFAKFSDTQMVLGSWTLGDSMLTVGGGIETTNGGGLNVSGNIVANNLSNTNSGDISLAGTPDYITLVGQVITRGLIDLTNDVTGALPYANMSFSNNIVAGDIAANAIENSEVADDAINTDELADYAVTKERLGFEVFNKSIAFPDTLGTSGPDTLWFGTHWQSAIDLDYSKCLSDGVDDATIVIGVANEDMTTITAVDTVTMSTNLPNSKFWGEETIPDARTDLPIDGWLWLTSYGENMDVVNVFIEGSR